MHKLTTQITATLKKYKTIKLYLPIAPASKPKQKRV